MPLADVKSGFVLGRGKASDWVFPEEDRLASGKHATIEKRLGQWTLVDAGSRNGIYVAGKRVERCRLDLGTVVGVGQCELSVEVGVVQAGGGAGAATQKQQAQCHRLEALNGPRKGEWIDLKEALVRVGSDPSNELCLQDLHISRFHAELSQNHRDCFLVALKTTNTTSVNREPCVSGVKRMLRDGDLVTFAFFDFRFLDKHVKHTHAMLWPKIVAAALTLGLLIAGYAIYLLAAPSAGDLMKRAKAMAAEENFAGADKALADAVHAREFKQYEGELAALAVQIDSWRKTAEEWGKVKAAFRDREWQDAVRGLSGLRCERMEDWNWNEKSALAARRQALAAKEALDVFVVGVALTNAVERKVERVTAVRDRLSAVAEDEGLANEPLFALFLEDAARVRDVLAADLEQARRLEQVLAQLGSRSVDFTKVSDELSDLSTHATAWVSQSVPRHLDAVLKLRAVADGLRENMRAVLALDFQAVKQPAGWPTPDECSAHPNLGVQRAYLEKSNLAILESARQVAHMMDTFKKMGVSPPKVPDVLGELADSERWERIFACPVLQGKIPNRMRVEPVDDYDRMLSVEGFYDLLFAMPERTGEEALESLGFTPGITTARRLYAQFKVYLDYTEREGWLVTSDGVLSQTAAFCRRMLAERDRQVTWLYRAGDMQSSPRRSLIGRAAALYLAPDGLYGEEARVKLAEDLKRFRAELQKVNQLYDVARPEDAIIVRNRILSEGLPGDPVVRRMWAQRE
jgi:pSer/pThr/pTyr-binding forkhead associated (FHA) protein